MLKDREGQISEEKAEMRPDCGFKMFVVQDVSV